MSGFGYTPGNVLLEYNIYPEDNASQEEGASVFRFYFFAWPCSVCSDWYYREMAHLGSLEARGQDQLDQLSGSSAEDEWVEGVRDGWGHLPPRALEKTALCLMIIVLLLFPCTTPTARRERGRRECTVIFVAVVVIVDMIIIITVIVTNA